MSDKAPTTSAVQFVRRHRLRKVNAGVTAVLRATAAFRRRRDRLAPITSALRSVLFVKLVGLGDAVMVRSLAEHLQRARPELQIGVLGGPATVEVLGALPGVTVISYDPAGHEGSLRASLRALRDIRSPVYDAVIDFEQHLTMIAMFIRATGIPVRIGLAARDNPRALFQTHTVDLTGQTYMWDAYVSLVRILDPSLTPSGTLPLRYPQSTIICVDGWWTRNGLHNCRTVVAFHLGSGGRGTARRWPVDRFVAVASALTGAEMADAVVLTGTADERPLVQQFARLFRGKVADATGLESIVMTAEVLRRCRLAISNDTGTMHLAASMGTPTLGLFGPNTPARYAPVGPVTDSVYATQVPCSPCINIHSGLVPDCFHPEVGRCMLDVDVTTVVQRAFALVQ